ncbi:hypothetical protein [Dyella flagellata]|uniref:Uncharacterized protein n=1 Tax=Dyella flagellata TaxID=1867833 RepID=A0ABQ5XE02_9GAMM|nr:hypothetical protein [Dyella flagellata]GLQ89870.1 hypothetical protein GCM10007898_34450 [Dyella flagellata]
MNTFVRGLALLLLALPLWATAQNTQDVSRIGGSIYPTMIKPAPVPVPGPTPSAHPSFATQGIQAVCIGSPAHADRCGAQANMAFCDVDDVGLAHCLSHYAKALVKQPDGARRALSFTVQDAHGASSIVTVLATLAQSDKAIAKAALDGMPSAEIVAMRTSTGDMPYSEASRLP